MHDGGLLESAVMRPRNHWDYGGERDVLRLAAYLLSGLVKNHPFEQGNKRTGAVAAILFIEINGYEWTLRDDGELAEWVIAHVLGHTTEEEMADLMRPHVAQP